MKTKKEPVRPEEKKKRRKRFRNFLIGFAVIYFLVVHVALPIYIKNKINNEIEALEGYSGGVEDVDIWLIFGAYDIQNVLLYSDEYGPDEPLLAADEITISLHWKALFQGKIVSEVELLNPEIHFAVADTPQREPYEDEIHDIAEFTDKDSTIEPKDLDDDVVKNNYEDIQLTIFSDLLLHQIPIKLNRIGVKNGSIYYKDYTADPKISVVLTDLNLTVNNLTNSRTLSENMIADVQLLGRIQYKGNIYASGKFDPYDKDISCDMDVAINDLPVTSLNSLFKTYVDFDVENGDFEMYSEVSINQGELGGYIKPFINDLKVVDYKKEKDEKFGQLAWESIIGLGSNLIKNWPQDDIATRINLKGDVNDPGFKVLKTIGSLFMHAIFHNLKPELDHDVQLYSLNQ